MNIQNEKCVMIIDENLPLGVAANAAAKMTRVSQTELRYLGIAICGEKKKVNKLTGSMGLLR